MQAPDHNRMLPPAKPVWGTPPAPLALNQSDSSFVKRHENITSLVWPDQLDSRFTAGSLSLIVCVYHNVRIPD